MNNDKLALNAALCTLAVTFCYINHNKTNLKSIMIYYVEQEFFLKNLISSLE